MTTPTSEQKAASALRMKQEIIGLILQHLEENGLRRSMHLLESEACYYFDMSYTKQMWQEGRWRELLDYLEPFLNQASAADEKKVKYLRWVIHRQHYWELIEAQKWVEAASLLSNQLKEINSFVPDNNYYSELQNLLLQSLSKENRSEASKKFADPNVRMENWNAVAEKLIGSIGIIADKTKKPHIPQPSRLRTIINQSLNWQHSRCDPKDPNPQMLDNSLFVDHRCRASNVVPKTSESPQMRNVTPSLDKTSPTPAASTPSPQQPSPSQPQQQTLRKRSYSETNTNNNAETEASTTEKENSTLLQSVKAKRPRSEDTSTETPPLPTHLFATIFFHEIRTLVIRFHPTNASLLLIGIDAPSSRGAILLYDVRQNKKLASLASPSVKQLLWLPGGKEFVVTFANTETIDLYTVATNREPVVITKSRTFRHTKSVFLIAACETTVPNEGRTVLLVSVSEGEKVNEYEVFVWDVQANNTSEPRFRCEWKNTENFAKPSAVAIATETIEKQTFTFVTLVVGKQCYVYVLNNNPAKYVPIFTEFSLPNTTRCLDVAVVKGSFIVCTSDLLTKHNLVNGQVEITYENYTEPSYKTITGNIDIYENRIAVPVGNKLKFWRLDSPKLLSATPFERSIGMISFNANGEMIAVATNTNILMLLTLPSLASTYKGPSTIHFSNQLEIMSGAEILPVPQGTSTEKTAVTGTYPSVTAALLQAFSSLGQKATPVVSSNLPDTESPSVLAVAKDYKTIDSRTNGIPSSSPLPTATVSSLSTTTMPTLSIQTPTSSSQYLLITKNVVQINEHYTFGQSHSSPVTQLYWTRNGTMALSLSNDGTLRMWFSSNPLTPQSLATASVQTQVYNFKCNGQQTSPVFAITNTEAYVLIAPGNGELILLAKQGGQLIEKAKLYDSSKDQYIISSLALHPDNQNLLIFGSLDGTLHSFIQNSKDKKRWTSYARATSFHQAKITGLSFTRSANNKSPVLLAISINGRVSAWLAEIDQENDKSPIRNVNLSFLRSFVIPSSSNETEGEPTLCTKLPPSVSPTMSVLMSQRKIVVKADPMLEATTTYTHTHSSNITTCCFAPNGTHVLCGLDTGAILVLDEKMTPSKILELRLPPDTYPTAFAQSNSAPNQLLIGTNKGTVHSITVEL
jgi:WD40 repeat protein